MRIFDFSPVGAARNILAEWNIDPLILSAAFTSFYNQHFSDRVTRIQRTKIKIRYNRKDLHHYGWYTPNVGIKLCGALPERYKGKELVHKTIQIIMHEMMHWIQHNVFRWNINRVTAGITDYYCEAELMARQFETHAKSVERMYHAIRSVKICSYT